MEDKGARAQEVAAFPWFALRVRSNHEQKTTNFLSASGYKIYLPTYRLRRRWSDRIKQLEVPLFPGYTFCRFDPRYALPILKVPAVMGIVGIGKTPVPVSEEELDSVERTVSSRLCVGPWPFLTAGQQVRIEYGPLKGIDGILIRFKESHRIVVSITLLQRSVAAEIDPDWLQPVAPWIPPQSVQHSAYERSLAVRASRS